MVKSRLQCFRDVVQVSQKLSTFLHVSQKLGFHKPSNNVRVQLLWNRRPSKNYEFLNIPICIYIYIHIDIDTDIEIGIDIDVDVDINIDIDIELDVDVDVDIDIGIWHKL